jgi:diguanylate cyclase (GGDEF)-like protein
MRILIVEDDSVIAETLKKALTDQHYVIDIATDGRSGWDFATTFTYGLIILDVELPKLDGLSFCRKLRNEGNHTPILLLTAAEVRSHLVAGLDAGADDYVTKPFNIEELMARIRALMRRGQTALPPHLSWGALQLDPSTCEVTWQQNPLRLTPKEYSLLELLLRNPQRIYSSSALIDHLWSLDAPPTEDTIRSHVKGLRQKLKAAGMADEPIETVYGIGYRLRKPPDPHAIAPVPSSVRSALSPEEMTPILSSAAVPAKTLPSIKGASGPLPEASLNVLQQGMQAIWSKSQPKLQERIATIAAAVQALQQKRCDACFSDRAQQAAHQLIGSLGMFGCESGSQVARHLEVFFQTDIQHQVAQVANVQQQFQQLQLEFQFLQTQYLASLSAESLRAESLSVESLSVESLSVESLSVESLSVESLSVESLSVESVSAAEALVKNASSENLDPSPLAAHSLAWATPKPTTADAKILVIDDDALIQPALEAVLQPWGMQVIALLPQIHWFEQVQLYQPDLIILDVAMEPSGIALCQQLRNAPQWSGLPILFLTAYSDVETMHRVFAAGADDFVTKPFVGPELVTRICNRLERSRLLRSLSETDPLTGVANRRKFSEDMDKFLRLSSRYRVPLSVALLEVDRMKFINESYGYAFGDQVLQQLGQLLRSQFRTEDLVGRWGNEKFVVGMYGTARSGAYKRLGEILEVFRRQVMVPGENQPVEVSFSVGVADYPQFGSDLISLYEAAKRDLRESRAPRRRKLGKKKPTNESRSPNSLQ